MGGPMKYKPPSWEINEHLLEDFDKRLSQEELNAESYLDWSDERLGELVRLQAKLIFGHHDGLKAAQVVAACQALAGLVIKAGHKGGYVIEIESERWGRIVVDVSLPDKGEGKCPKKVIPFRRPGAAGINETSPQQQLDIDSSWSPTLMAVKIIGGAAIVVGGSLIIGWTVGYLLQKVVGIG